MKQSNHRRRLARAALPTAFGALLAFPLAAAVLQAQEAASRDAMPATRPAALMPASTMSTSTPAASMPAASMPMTSPATSPVAVGPDTVVFTIGDESVTLAEYELFVSMLRPEDQNLARQPGPARRSWAESFVNMKLLAREAAKRQLEQDPEVRRMLSVTRDQVLANALVNHVQEHIDDAAMKKYFEEHKQGLERVSARHILIRFKGSPVPVRPGQADLSEADAKAKAEKIIARIKAGEDFAAVAKAESDDTGSGQEGGDLGSFTRGRMVPAFEQAAFSQKEGEVGGPVRSDFGWHVIQVTGKFDTFEKLQDVLREQMVPQQTNLLIRQLRAEHPPKFNEQVIGTALPAELEMPGRGE